jgi:hypothetical protein
VPSPTFPPPKPVATSPPQPPPAASPTAAAPPAPPPGSSGEVRLDDTAFQGGFRNPGDAQYRGRTAMLLYGARTPYSRMSARFDLPAAPRDAELAVVAVDSQGGSRTQLAILVNDREIFRGPSPFPDEGPGQGEARWTERRLPIPDGLLRSGANTVAIQNLDQSDRVGQPPYAAVDLAVIQVRF